MAQGGVTTTFGYDDIDQLTSESRSGYSASYTYDANGNRATKALGGTTHTYNYDDADKLTSITSGGNTIKSYSYDTAGRTTGVTVSGNATTLAYDYEGRITTITYPNSSTNTFTYNGLDTMDGKVDSGGTKTYLRDGVGVTAPVLNDAAANYTPGISERRSSTTTYYHGGIKNAETQTGSGQTVLASQTFDAFGNPDTSSGTWKGPFAYGGPFGYQSDSDSGLMLLGHRYYDSSTGRFLSRDPAQSGRNWYAYSDGNPVGNADPGGLTYWEDVGKVFVGYGKGIIGPFVGAYDLGRDFFSGGWRDGAIFIKNGARSAGDFWRKLGRAWDGDPEAFGEVYSTVAMALVTGKVFGSGGGGKTGGGKGGGGGGGSGAGFSFKGSDCPPEIGPKGGIKGPDPRASGPHTTIGNRNGYRQGFH